MNTEAWEWSISYKLDSSLRDTTYPLVDMSREQYYKCMNTIANPMYGYQKLQVGGRYVYVNYLIQLCKDLNYMINYITDGTRT